MEFYRIEYILKNFEEALDEEDKQYKKQEKEQQKQYQKSTPKPYKPQSSSGTNYGGFKTPKLDMPKIYTPKLKL